MITLIALLAIGYLIGLAAMVHRMKHSPEGYEDETGFHFGTLQPVTNRVETAGVIEFVRDEQQMAA